jgi:hypothetical protein
MNWPRLLGCTEQVFGRSRLLPILVGIRGWYGMRWSDKDWLVDGMTLGNQEPNQTSQRFGVEVGLNDCQATDRVGGLLLLAPVQRGLHRGPTACPPPAPRPIQVVGWARDKRKAYDLIYSPIGRRGFTVAKW